MKLYDSTPEQQLLAATAWARMEQAGELKNIFLAHERNLYKFLNRLENAPDVYYEDDAQGIWALAWYEYFFDGALFAAWIRPDMRGTREMFEQYEEALDAGKGKFPAILATTTQEVVARLLQQTGFAWVADLGPLMDGKHLWLYRLKETK